MLSKSVITGKCFWRGTEITQEEYNCIAALIQNRPAAPAGYGYQLNDALEWEQYELNVEEEELNDEEALEIIVGGAV